MALQSRTVSYLRAFSDIKQPRAPDKRRRRRRGTIHGLVHLASPIESQRRTRNPAGRCGRTRSRPDKDHVHVGRIIRLGKDGMLPLSYVGGAVHKILPSVRVELWTVWVIRGRWLLLSVSQDWIPLIDAFQRSFFYSQGRFPFRGWTGAVWHFFQRWHGPNGLRLGSTIGHGNWLCYCINAPC